MKVDQTFIDFALADLGLPTFGQLRCRRRLALCGDVVLQGRFQPRLDGGYGGGGGYNKDRDRKPRY